MKEEEYRLNISTVCEVDMFLVTNECSLAYFWQNLGAFFTNQGVETPCY